MGSKIVRILAAFWGYFQNPLALQGYGAPAFESRSQRVSRNEDWLDAWHQVRRTSPLETELLTKFLAL
jgi:hypothetical protein